MIVENMPANFFTPERRSVLANLVRHIVFSDMISEKLKVFDVASLEDSGKFAAFRQLAKLHLKQSKTVAVLSTKLRLTPQSRYQPDAVAVRG